MHNYLDRLDDLQDVVTDNSELILEQIDLDKLLQDPEGYLMGLADAFLEEHIDEVQKAHKMVVTFANKILSKV